MKLYYSPGTCALSPHIVLHEAGLDFELVLARTKTHKLVDGTDYYTINPKGYVPLLELTDGTRLTEGPAIVQYIADQVPAKKLAPANGNFERYRLQEWLNFITSELHKAYSPLFNPATPAEYKSVVSQRLLDRYKWIEGQLTGKSYLMGESFCVADAYLFTVTTWAPRGGLDLSALSNVQAFMARMAARPAVNRAMKEQGLVK